MDSYDLYMFKEKTRLKRVKKRQHDFCIHLLGWFLLAVLLIPIMVGFFKWSLSDALDMAMGIVIGSSAVNAITIAYKNYREEHR